MSDIFINATIFQERLATLYNTWKNDKRSPDGVFGAADSLVIVTGKADQDTIYHKNNAVHVSFHHPPSTNARDRGHDINYLTGSSFGSWVTNSP